MSDLHIESATYTIDVRTLAARKGTRRVEVRVSVRLPWAVPLLIRLELPDDADVLRELVSQARAGAFASWLGDHGYDQLGRGDGEFGEIAQ